MKTQLSPTISIVFSVALISLGTIGCENTQGAVNAPKASSLGPAKDEIEPAPKSTSFSGKKDVFQAAEYSPGILKAFPHARQIRLQVGELLEVYRGNNVPGDGAPEMAFYLPVEATSMVQLIVESRGFTKTYFLRGLVEGETVGGVVERRWLDGPGTGPDNPADEARIQKAVRGEPFLILVQ